ncbi:MAG TPA: thiamine pyrophosphate-dependent enzyme, partial [Dehalococcoidia bacterium]|nr:thiamine pyrophosphate-dependent enzyme [Dehalococcoidia bacterium]
MLLIRRFEDAAAEQYTRARIGGFLHLYNGQEAVAVGAIPVLREDDYIVTHYRDHGQALARGIEPGRVMAELFGKETGVSRGKGGSMHLFDASRHFMGGYAIVGGHLPLACGLALAAQYRGEDTAVLCFFGDGAVNEGEWHESLNLAAVWNLPVVFFCENNEYAMGTAISRASAVIEVWKRTCAYDIPSERIDGMDLWAVRDATQRALAHVRAGKGPILLEAVTYRFRGHSMADP